MTAGRARLIYSNGMGQAGASSKSLPPRMALPVTTLAVLFLSAAIMQSSGRIDDDNGKGSAYIFKSDGTSWSQQQKLLASDGAAGDYFGYSVSISGDYAIVGAYQDDDNGQSSGSAYIFKRDGTSWSQQQKLTRLGWRCQ